MDKLKFEFFDFDSYEGERELTLKIAIDLFIAYRTQPGAISIYYNTPVDEVRSCGKNRSKAFIEVETVLHNEDCWPRTADFHTQLLVNFCLRDAQAFVEALKQFRKP